MFDPIYTEPKQCQDCYKCVRECAIKSIRFEGEQKAYIIQEACIYCGHCVDVCPVGAKKIRSDLLNVKLWIEQGQEVIAILAPSIVSNFKDLSYDELVKILKTLGFSGVADVSSGASIVTSEIARNYQMSSQSISISTACPSVVFLIQKYYPRLAGNLTQIHSPALATATELREKFPHAKIVFIGPCISKMKEADANSEKISAVLGFMELDEWITELKNNSRKEKIQTQTSELLLAGTNPGKLYPMDGGMCEALKQRGIPNDVELLTFSGPHRIKQILDHLQKEGVSSGKVFLELLACEGGCLQGPLSVKESHLIEKILLQKKSFKAFEADSFINLDIKQSHHFNFQPEELPNKIFKESEILAALKSIGKNTNEDELNCSGCGHETCRDFAKAILSGLANHTMCVSYMRKLAANKANVLIRAMPSAIVIVDKDLRILESNQKFSALLDEETRSIEEIRGNLESMLLSKIIPFSDLFESVLNSDEEILDKEIEYKNKILTVSIFPIEKNRIVGGFIQDVTEPFIQREQIVKKANEIIIKNLTTVQKIAYLLGENAAESEVLINSIIKSFSLNPEKE